MEEVIDIGKFILDVDPENLQSIMLTTTSGRVVFEEGPRARFIWSKLEDLYNSSKQVDIDDGR